MSNIFISHSSSNNAAAFAVAMYLQENGWTDCFLDVSPQQGLLPGERWQAALKSAADRCEAVIFLISPAWRDSRWCLAEFLLAKQLGKKIFGVLIEPTPFETLPVEMTAEWQLCDLTRGEERRTFTVRADGLFPDAEITFAESGLAHLRGGLQKAGLDPSKFPWPPAGDPERIPYRGLKPLDVDDAAIFFGRDASIVRGLDALRRMRERGLEALFVILGASGSGKSSYLRAGLWPRLARDDVQFLPLPVIRPRTAVITGPEGLVDSFEKALRTRGVPRTRADIRSRLQSPGGFPFLLEELHEAAQCGTTPGHHRPAIVILIDQGEELFVSEGRTETDRFLTMLRDALDRRNRTPDATRPACIAVVAIRSDAYDRLQSEPLLASIQQVPFNLTSIARGEFTKIIAGPAEQSTISGQRLTVDPLLAERLLQDAEGSDALPLLAFTLERLLLDYGSDGELSAADYDALGGVRGSIEAAVEAAFARPMELPVVPAAREERERLLRLAFIPWLARIDPDTDEPQRRVATLDEVPGEAQGVLARLIDARLVVSDRREVDGRAVTVLEVAHEALLRQWPSLMRWLDEDADALKTVEAVRRAAQEWLAQGRQAAWLTHTADRLQRAEHLRTRGDFDQLMGAVGREYLVTCRARDEQARVDREAQFARIAAEQMLTARAQRRSKIALGAIAIVLALFGVWVVTQTRTVARQQAAVLVVAAEDALGKRQLDRALRFAVLAARNTWLSPTVPEAETVLARAASASSEIGRIQDGAVVSAALSPDGKRIVAAFSDGARVLDAQSLQEMARIPDARGAVSAAFSSDGRRVVVTSPDGTVRICDASTGQAITTIPGKATGRSSAFSPDGRRVVRMGDDGTKIFDVATGTEIVQPLVYSLVSFSPDGQHLVRTAFDDETAQIWDVSPAREIATIRHGGQVVTAAFSPDGRLIATASWDKTARISDASTGREIIHFDHDRAVVSAQFSPDGQRLVTRTDGEARLFDGRAAKEIARFVIEFIDSASITPKLIAFTSDGQQVVASGGKATELFDGATGMPISRFDHDTSCSSSYSVSRRRVVSVCADGTLRLHGTDAYEVARIVHDGPVESVAFSSDGLRLATASDDRTARIVDSHTGKEIARAVHDGVVESVAFSPDGHRIVTASGDAARIIDVESGKETLRIRHDGRVTSAVFSPDGHRVVTSSWDRTARVVDADTGKEIARVVHDGRVDSVEFSPDGQRITTRAGLTRVFDAQNGRQIGPATKAARLVRSPNGRQVLQRISTSRLFRRKPDTSTPDGVVVADARTGLEVARFGGPRYNESSFESIIPIWLEPGKSIVFSPDGQRVATASFASSNDNTARIWDIADATKYDDDLISFACSRKLVGASRLSSADVAMVPLLLDREGDDVCRPAALIQRIIRSASRYRAALRKNE